MKLIESGQEVEFIDIDRDRVPCSLLIKLIDRTYRMTFRVRAGPAEFGGIPDRCSSDALDPDTVRSFCEKRRIPVPLSAKICGFPQPG